MKSNKNYIFTSESVSEGHPDKICDQISDLILDIYLGADKNARVACETMATTNRVIVSGEVNIKKNQKLVSSEIIENAIRQKVREIGYEQTGFHWKKLIFENHLHEQSQDIAMGVDESDKKEQGAGDQGIMFGYACSETENFMPAPIECSHNILKTLAEFRHNHDSFFGPDSKSQVSLIYENDQPVGISSVVISTQHLEDVHNDDVKEKVIQIAKSVIPKHWNIKDTDFIINPTGRFVVGGPDGDTGLTGRKIVVDTYGGAAPHGGGAFSGKDQTKVDRSAAYMARYIAKNIVAAKLARKCLIQLSYAIGMARPVSFYIKTDDDTKLDINLLIKFLSENLDLSPGGIRKHLNLDRPFYTQTASYGHFGRQPCKRTGCFSWENLDLVEKIQNSF